MSPDAFGYLTYSLQSQIQKQNTTSWKPISVKERPAGTLCYRVTGDSQQLVSWSNRIGKASVSKIIKGTTNAIMKSLTWCLLETTSGNGKLDCNIRLIWKAMKLSTLYWGNRWKTCCHRIFQIIWDTIL